MRRRGPQVQRRACFLPQSPMSKEHLFAVSLNLFQGDSGGKDLTIRNVVMQYGTPKDRAVQFC